MHQGLFPILKRLCGQTVILANPRIRKCNRSLYRECDFEPLILADHQVILETANRDALKEDVCHFFSSQRHWCVPSEGDKDHLTLGCTKPVPTQVFVECLLHFKVPFFLQRKSPIYSCYRRGYIVILLSPFILVIATSFLPTSSSTGTCYSRPSTIDLPRLSITGAASQSTFSTQRA